MLNASNRFSLKFDASGEHNRSRRYAAAAGGPPYARSAKLQRQIVCTHPSRYVATKGQRCARLWARGCLGAASDKLCRAPPRRPDAHYAARCRRGLLGRLCRMGSIPACNSDASTSRRGSSQPAVRRSSPKAVQSSGMRTLQLQKACVLPAWLMLCPVLGVGLLPLAVEAIDS
jgi:hypothetical protein